MASSDLKDWCSVHHQEASLCTQHEHCMIHHAVTVAEINMIEDTSPGPLDMASIEFKTVYDSLTEQGFSDAQALYLVAAQITGNPGIAPGLPADD